MQSRFRSYALLALLGLPVGAACGGEDDTSDSTGSSTGTDGGSTPSSSGTGSDAGSASADNLKVDYTKGPLMPLSIGSTWTYRVTDGDKIDEKKLTAEKSEAVGGTGPNAGKTAVKLVADRVDELTVSWVAADGDRVLRYREQVVDVATQAVEKEDVWEPYRLYADGTEAHRGQGATWLEEHTETTTKDGVAETSTISERWTVQSAAESVTVPAGTFTAVVFTKAGASKLKTYWYVPGVGKVKETGGQTEELSAYAIK
jgi:hypothetical protein